MRVILYKRFNTVFKHLLSLASPAPLATLIEHKQSCYACTLGLCLTLACQPRCHTPWSLNQKAAKS